MLGRLNEKTETFFIIHLTKYTASPSKKHFSLS